MRKRMKGWLVAGACLLAVAGCGNDMVVVGTTEVKGTVGGVVLEALPGLPPLAGVQATVIAGGRTFTASTNEGGVFTVSGVPAGTIVVQLHDEKHVDVFLRATLDISAGNFPLSNPSLTLGPVALAPSTGTFKVRLVDESGNPASNVKVTARATAAYLDVSNGAPASAGNASASATSAADGLVTFTGLPDWNACGPVLNDALTVSVPPIMLPNAGESYSFLGGDYSYNGRRESAVTPTIVLSGPRSALQVLSSNLDYLETGTTSSTPSLVKTSGPINIVFNQAVAPSSVRTVLYLENGQIAPATATPTVNANVVSLNFSKPLDPGLRYNLQFHANSLSDQAKEFNALAPFFSQPDVSPIGLSMTLTRQDPNNPNDYLVYFTEPVGLGNGSTAAIPCVLFFEADLDGNSQLTSPGEWNPNGNSALKCVNDGRYTLRPDEPTFAGATQGSPITGFTTRWRITVKPYAPVCVGNYQCCVGGAVTHLQFSRNPDNASVLRRTNGAPVPDQVFMLSGFTCP